MLFASHFFVNLYYNPGPEMKSSNCGGKNSGGISSLNSSQGFLPGLVSQGAGGGQNPKAGTTN